MQTAEHQVAITATIFVHFANSQKLGFTANKIFDKNFIIRAQNQEWIINWKEE